MAEKSCPKCSKEMKASSYLGTIPAIKQTAIGDEMSNKSAAILDIVNQVCSGLPESRQIARNDTLTQRAVSVLQSDREALNDSGFRCLAGMKFQTEWV
jgi:hypothetical protein